MTPKNQPDHDSQDQSNEDLTKLTESATKPRLFDDNEGSNSNEDRPPDIVVEN